MLKETKYLNNILPTLLISTTLILAAFLRFYGLGFQSLWNDEFYSLWASSFSSLRDVFKFGIIPDTHPPAFQVILWLVIKIFGNSEVILRTPSAIFGVFAVFGTYLVGKELFSYKEGLIASAIMTVSSVQIFYSQEARSGMLMVFVSVFSVLYWIKNLRKIHVNRKIPLSIAIPYVLFAIFSCYTHYLCFLFIALQAIFSLFLFSNNFEKLKRLLIPYLLIGLCYLPWLPRLLYQLNHNQDRIAWISTPKLTAFGKFWIFAFEDNIYFAGVMAIIILVYFIGEYKKRKILSIFKTRKEEKYPFVQDFLLLYWIVLPQLIIFIISITEKPLFVHRYFLFLLPAIYLLLARAITTIKIKSKYKSLLGIFIIAFIFFNLLFSKDYYSRKTKEPFRDVANYIVNTNIDNTILISNALPISLDYYFEKLGSSLRTDLRINPPKSDTNLVLIEQAIKDSGSKELLYIKQVLGRHRDPELEDQLEISMNLVNKETFTPDVYKYYYRNRIEVYLFEVK